MIRVGLLLTGDPGGWLGGLNYFRSLLGAVATLDEPGIEAILLTDRRHAAAWAAHFPGVCLVPTSLLERWSPGWILRKGLEVLSGRDLLLRRRLRGLGVACLTHSAPLGPAFRNLRVLGWIPDFQHVHLPGCFSPEELGQRDAGFMKICRECDRVIVSSQDAARDLAAFCPEAAGKARVLHFVPMTPEVGDLPEPATLRALYGIEGPFFHLPNQFWKHKNHATVIRALQLLREGGRPVQVLATGLTSDYRNPGHFEALMAQARAAGVDSDFRVLGVVPFPHMLGLMRSAVAVVNPSLFEGWSTTVEEVRRLGARAILSDIGVHREQAVSGARYFPAEDAEALAMLLREALEAPWEAGAGTAGPQAFRAFGEAYRAILLDLLGGDR